MYIFLKLLFFTIYLIVSSAYSYASWSKGEVDFANKITTSDPSYVTTARANCYARGVGKLKTPHQFFREEFASYFTKNPMEFDLYFPESMILARPESLPAKIPSQEYKIVHVFPGIFGSTDDGIMYIFLEQILSGGNIAVVYPNPLSKQYFKSAPKQISAGNIEEEADYFKHLVFEAESRVQKMLPQNSKRTRTRFLGLSYGAFVSTITSAKVNDLKSNHVDELVLFSPPIEIKSALAYVDTSLQKMEKEFSHFPIVHDGWNMWQVCNSKLKDGKDFNETAKKMVLHMGFLESLSKSLVTYMQNRGDWKFWWYPFRLMTNNYYEWKKSLRFGKVINDFKLTRTKVFLSSKQSKLDFWIGQLRSKSKTTIKIFSSKDDFLNHNVSWNGVQIPQQSLILKDRGGHLGFLDDPNFSDLLSRIYAP